MLCELINAIWPGSVKKINQGAMPFIQRENIVAYLEAGKRAGLRETDCFVTGDLYEASNMGQGQRPSSAGERNTSMSSSSQAATAVTAAAASLDHRTQLTSALAPV